ncbi:MAG: signal-transduction protein [uncultured bacterium]|nr:MAG: signal-transduction protein [uncultured bacterium]
MSRVSQLLKAAHSDKNVVTVSPGTSVVDAAFILRHNNIGALPVMDDGVLVGIISERDMVFDVLANRTDPATIAVADCMTKDPACVTPFTDIMDCMKLMEEMKVRHIPVVDNGLLVGIVSLRDILYVLWKNQELLAQQFESYILGLR